MEHAPAHGRSFEEFMVGQKFDHHWGRTVYHHDSMMLAAATLDFSPIRFNKLYAEALGHRDIPTSPLWTWMIVLGLSVEDLSEAGGPFLGVDQVVFGVPVFAGDTLYSSSTVVSARASRSRNGWGIVSWKTVGRNQCGETVISFARTNLVKMRSESTVGRRESTCD